MKSVAVRKADGTPGSFHVLTRVEVDKLEAGAWIEVGLAPIYPDGTAPRFVLFAVAADDAAAEKLIFDKLSLHGINAITPDGKPS